MKKKPSFEINLLWHQTRIFFLTHSDKLRLKKGLKGLAHPPFWFFFFFLFSHFKWILSTGGCRNAISVWQKADKRCDEFNFAFTNICRSLFDESEIAKPAERKSHQYCYKLRSTNVISHNGSRHTFSPGWEKSSYELWEMTFSGWKQRQLMLLFW